MRPEQPVLDLHAKGLETAPAPNDYPGTLQMKLSWVPPPLW